MTYYKLILPNDQIKYINSNNFIWYSTNLNTFIGCDESKAEYIIVDNEIYRIPWLKYEPKKTKGLYPIISAEYATENEYKEYLNSLGEK